MTGEFSWVDAVALLIAIASLGVTIAIFILGRRLTFRQQRARIGELEAKAWKVLGPIRTQGLNSKIIVMNVDRYKRGYDGSNELTWRGYAYTGPELIEISHGGLEVILGGHKSYYDDAGRRTLAATTREAPTVLQVGHVPWTWIEDIQPDGDEFDGSAIFFVRHRAPGRQPYDFITFREGQSVKFGPNNRDYYRPLPELGIARPKFFHEWWDFAKLLRKERRRRTEALRSRADRN